jgi:hypothetical protein
MSGDAAARSYWREEFFLIALLLLFFAAIVGFSFAVPFDARLFPLIIGSAGFLLTIAVAVEQIGRRRENPAPAEADDAAARSDWPRFATALLSAPIFSVAFWLFGFVVASLAAMLLMPWLMGYRKRGELLLVAVITVAVLSIAAPYLLNVDLPHGLVGDWLIDKLALRPG